MLNNRMRLGGVVFLIVGMIFSVGAWTQTKAVPPVKIGALLDYTGTDPLSAKEFTAGMEWVLNETKGMIAGRKIELLKEDDAGDPVVAMDKARKLVEADKVNIVFGPLSSRSAIPVAQYLAKMGMPDIMYMMHPMDVADKGRGLVFQHGGTLKGSTYHIGRYAYEKMGWRTVSALHADHVAGQELVGGLLKGFKDAGGTVVQDQSVPLFTMDYAPYLAALKPADFVAFWFIPPDAKRFFTAYQSYGLKKPLILTNSWTLRTSELQQIGDPVLGTLGEGHYNWAINTPFNNTFVKAWKAKHGDYPDSYNVSGYITMALFRAALLATKGDVAPKKIVDALAKVKVQTPAGYISFNSDGVGIGDMHIMKAVKEQDRYYWKAVDTYPQVLIKADTEPSVSWKR